MGELIFTIGIALALGIAVYFIEAKACSSKWEGSGMESKYALFAGCRVRMPDGRWLPAENLRDIDLRKDK